MDENAAIQIQIDSLNRAKAILQAKVNNPGPADDVELLRNQIGTINDELTELNQRQAALVGQAVPQIDPARAQAIQTGAAALDQAVGRSADVDAIMAAVATVAGA